MISKSRFNEEMKFAFAVADGNCASLVTPDSFHVDNCRNVESNTQKLLCEILNKVHIMDYYLTILQ